MKKIRFEAIGNALYDEEADKHHKCIGNFSKGTESKHICELLNDYDLTVKELQNEVEFWKKVYYDFEEPVAKCRKVHYELITLLKYLYLEKDMIIDELPISDESKEEFYELAEYCKSIEDDSLYP